MQTAEAPPLRASRQAALRPVRLCLALLAISAALVPVTAAGEAAAEMTATSSAVTVKASEYDLDLASSPFPDLEVTVSQTTDLVSQGIEISYKGGTTKSTPPAGTIGGDNFLQIAQCWGEDPVRPGHPDRRTCQYGGTAGWSATRDGNRGADGVEPEDVGYTAAGQWFSTTSIPFVGWTDEGVVDETKAPADKVLMNTTAGADGTIVMKPEKDWVNLSTNRFFSANTTNEVNWAPFGADGTGSVPFELQTAMQSPGLGCGNPVTAADGSVTGSSCWLVIIPRGLSDNGSNQIDTPGLWWDAWEHHLAVKLDFKPLGVRCELGAAERQLAGSEMAASAIASWQPVVCQGDGGAPFTLAQVPESDAVVSAAGTEPSPLALTSRPVDMTLLPDSTDPLAYAPVALAGVTFSFKIDSQPNPQSASAEYKARSNLPLTPMKLTPRLVAKLLTASYLNAIPGGADATHLGYKSFAEPGKNARTIVWDPDFQAVNDPEWAVQTITDASIADALSPIGRSDVAVRVWEYVLADPEAKAWLDGKPDPWGMIVNPWYSTNPKVNPTGQALELPTDSFPKADPAEKPDKTVDDPANGTGPINLVTWRPYTSSLTDGGYRVLRGDGLILGAWNRFSVPQKFDKSQRQIAGGQHLIALSSSPAASQYQTATALLRNPAGEFVAATSASLGAAAEAMTATAEQSQVLRFDPTSAKAKSAAAAYPLAVPVYAALNPAQTDGDARAAYADLIAYAVGPGQTPGTNDGELPAGYSPIPAAWRTQALAAAKAIRDGGWPKASASPSPSPSPTASSPAPAENPAPAAVAQPLVQAPDGQAPTVQAPASEASAAAPTGPAAVGQAAGELTGPATPDDPSAGPLAAVVPATGLIAAAAALGIPAISRFRRLP